VNGTHEVNVEESIDLLGIPAGKIDIQRLFYCHVIKMYNRPDWTLDEMNHVNFDWFRPRNCFRHTSEEVEKWVAECGLALRRMHLQEAGICAIASALASVAG